MERKIVYCEECGDHVEIRFSRGKWYCEECGQEIIINK